MIKQKKKPCKSCGVDSYIFSKGRCKSCSTKEDRKPIAKITERAKVKKEGKKKVIQELHQFYLDLWDKRADKNGNVRCFETEILLSHTLYKHNLCCYSHQIPKSKRPDLAFEEENVLIVLPDIHAAWEANPEKCPKMKEYTEKLKEKYL